MYFMFLFWRSYLVSYYNARAAFVFKNGTNRNDYLKALHLWDRRCHKKTSNPSPKNLNNKKQKSRYQKCNGWFLFSTGKLHFKIQRYVYFECKISSHIKHAHSAGNIIYIGIAQTAEKILVSNVCKIHSSDINAE